MRARTTGSKRPCTYCGTPTMFERDVRGKRGALKGFESCCVECGEQSARREKAKR